MASQRVFAKGPASLLQCASAAAGSKSHGTSFSSGFSPRKGADGQYASGLVSRSEARAGTRPAAKEGERPEILGAAEGWPWEERIQRAEVLGHNLEKILGGLRNVEGHASPGESDEQSASPSSAVPLHQTIRESPATTIQRMLVGWELETHLPIYRNGERPDRVDGFAEQAADYAHVNVDGALSAPLGDGFEVHVDSTTLGHRTALARLNPGSKLHIAEIVTSPVPNRAALLEKMQIVRQYVSYFADHREFPGAAYSIGWPTPAADFGGGDAAIPQATLENLLRTDWAATAGDNLYNANTQLTFQGSSDMLKTIADQDSARIPTGRRVPLMGADGQPRMRFGKPVTVGEMVQHPVVDRDSMAHALGLPPDSDLTRRAIDVTVKIFKDTMNFLTKPAAGTIKNAVGYLIRADLRAVFADIQAEQRDGLEEVLIDRIMSLKPGALNIPPVLAQDLFDSETGAIKVHPITYKLLTGQDQQQAEEIEHVDPTLHGMVTGDSRAPESAYSPAFWPWEKFVAWLALQVSTAVRSTQVRPVEVTGPLHGSRNLGLLPEAGDGDEAQSRIVFEGRVPLDVNLNGDALPGNIVGELDRMGFDRQ